MLVVSLWVFLGLVLGAIAAFFVGVYAVVIVSMVVVISLALIYAIVLYCRKAARRKSYRFSEMQRV